MSDERLCVQCGEPLPEPKPTGRPRRYCSKACRRAGEFEIKRTNAEIAYLMRLETDLNVEPWRGTEKAYYERLGMVQERARELGDRLRALCDDEDDNPKDTP